MGPPPPTWFGVSPRTYKVGLTGPAEGRHGEKVSRPNEGRTPWTKPPAEVIPEIHPEEARRSLIKHLPGTCPTRDTPCGPPPQHGEAGPNGVRLRVILHAEEGRS